MLLYLKLHNHKLPVLQKPREGRTENKTSEGIPVAKALNQIPALALEGTAFNCQDCFRNQEIRWPPDVAKWKQIKRSASMGLSAQPWWPPAVESSIVVEDADENRGLYRVSVSRLLSKGFGRYSTTIARSSPPSGLERGG